MNDNTSVILAPDRELNRLCEITPTALHILGDLDQANWTRLLLFLSKGQAACQWAIGDALNYGFGRYERGQYDEACAATGLEPQTLRHFKSVAGKVESCIRMHNLTWAHHQLVAPLSPREQKKWLEKAAKSKWTVAQLRLYLREASIRDEIEAAPTKAVVAQCSAIEWLATIEECDLLFTDPPYSTDVDDVAAFATDWVPPALSKLKPSARAFICIGAYPIELLSYLSTVTAWVAEHPNFCFPNVLVWTYRNTLGPSPKEDYKLNWQAVIYVRGRQSPPLNCPEMIEQFTVQDVTAPDGRHGTRHHEWQKPDELAERFIRHSTLPGDTVIDPFAGTGTFLLAAARLGRRALGCDIDNDMLTIAQERGCISNE